MLKLITAAMACGTWTFSATNAAQTPFVRFMVESFVAFDAPRSAALSVSCEDVPEALRPGLGAFADRPLERPDVADLRVFWQEHYLAGRAARGDLERVPATLDAFAAVFPYKTWPQRVIELSAVKRRTRVVYASDSVSVAETLETDAGDLGAPVRETEVTTERRDGSGNWDFYAYDRLGQLEPESTFPAGPRPSPTICAACHYDSEAGLFIRSPAR